MHVVFMRAGLQKPNNKDAPKTRRCVQCQAVEEQCLCCLPSDSNVRKDWMNFIFNEDPDRVSKILVLCSLHFTADSFTNKAQFDAGFSESLKLKDNAV